MLSVLFFCFLLSVPVRLCSVIVSPPGQLLYFFSLLTLVLLKPDILCLCKQCRSRSVGFWRSQLIWKGTVCHNVNLYRQSWSRNLIGWNSSGRGILIYSAGQGLIHSIVSRIYSEKKISLNPYFTDCASSWTFSIHFTLPLICIVSKINSLKLLNPYFTERDTNGTLMKPNSCQNIKYVRLRI